MASIGIGVYLLCVVWFTALMLVWISVRTGHSIGKLAILGSIFFSIILFSLPKLDVEFTYSEKLYQKVYTVRYFTIAVILLGTVLGTTYSYLFANSLEPLEFRKIRSFGR